jgi:heptosyltransferase-2
LIPFWAKIPQRIGYASEGRSFLLTHCLAKPSKKNKPPMLDWYGQLAGIPQGLVPRPHLVGSIDAFGVNELTTHSLTTSELSMTAFSANVGILSELKSKKFLAVAPGAEYGPAKRWPVQYFAATLQAYLEFGQTRSVCLLGGPKDIAVCQAVLEALPQALRIRVYTLAGKTSLDQAIALIAQSEALLTNDSGLMHVAAALQVPLQAVFGSSDPRHTPPLSDQAQVHWLHLDCSPCFKRECPLGHTRCLVSLTPERVISALNDQLKMTVEP